MAKYHQNRREGYKKEYYWRRVKHGWCPICPNEIINPRFTYCLKCRAKRAKAIKKKRKLKLKLIKLLGHVPKSTRV